MASESESKSIPLFETRYTLDQDATASEEFSACVRAGAEWLVDAEGCCEESLRNLTLLGRLCEQILTHLDLHVVGAPMWHRFPAPGGVTGLFLLTESHLACHTYPELGVATFNLYCCRPRPSWPWEERLREALGANHVNVRFVERGRAETTEGGLP